MVDLLTNLKSTCMLNYRMEFVLIENQQLHPSIEVMFEKHRHQFVVDLVLKIDQIYMYILLLTSSFQMKIYDLILHCKKRGVSPNPQKRFRRFLKASKEDQSLKKRIKKIYENFKGSPVYPGKNLLLRNLFKFRTGEKGVYKTLRVSYYTLMVSY